MEFKKEENRIYIDDENGNVLAEIEFEKLADNKYNIYHTFVDERLRGQGVASKLVEAAINEIRARDGEIQATCSYAKTWIEKHKENE